MSDALAKLIAAVEVETFCQGDWITQAEGDIITAAFPLTDDFGAWEYVTLAIDGSLDAAKVLHEALLPGCRWKLYRSEPDAYGCNVLAEDTSYSTSPARAWLLAILKAYRATKP